MWYDYVRWFRTFIVNIYYTDKKCILLFALKCFVQSKSVQNLFIVRWAIFNTVTFPTQLTDVSTYWFQYR